MEIASSHNDSVKSVKNSKDASKVSDSIKLRSNDSVKVSKHSKVSKGSKVSKEDSREVVRVEPELSMSDLDMLANHNKIRNKVVVENSSIEVVKKSPKKEKKREKTELDSSEAHDIRRRLKIIKRENKDSEVLKEKSMLLFKLSTLLKRHPNQNSVLTIESNTLEEIRNEFTRIKSTRENEQMVGFCKDMLLMGCKGIEMLNSQFDPVGADLDGWGSAMAVSLSDSNYDDVLGELYEKYKGSGQMAPELKLVMMVCGSAAMFAATKKIQKLTTGGQNDTFNNILRNFAPQAQQHANQQQNTPELSDSDSDSDTPSKLRGPDTIQLESIIKKMNENRNNQVPVVIEESTEMLEKIIEKPVKAKRGRKPKA